MTFNHYTISWFRLLVLNNTFLRMVFSESRLNKPTTIKNKQNYQRHCLIYVLRFTHGINKLKAQKLR